MIGAILITIIALVGSLVFSIKLNFDLQKKLKTEQAEKKELKGRVERLTNLVMEQQDIKEEAKHDKEELENCSDDDLVDHANNLFS